jgi:hypothetical protein
MSIASLDTATTAHLKTAADRPLRGMSRHLQIRQQYAESDCSLGAGKTAAILAVISGMTNEGLVRLSSSVNRQYLTVYEAG